MKKLPMAASLAFALSSLQAAETLFELQPVVEGVFAAIAKPQYKTNCNAGIVLLEDGVLVVDTHSKPSAARALIDQIKTLTDKPVRYVVNSHFHWDHYQGNAAYPSVWPEGFEIISSTATRDSIQLRGIPRVKHEILALPPEIERLQAELAQAAGEEEKEVLRENLRQAKAYLADLRSMRTTLPTLTFERSLVLHRSTRTVQILWLGKGHTDGDVVVYLPREKVLISGDLLHGSTPYMGDSYPYDWIQTLEELERLDFDYVISGHGGVMRGKERLRLWKQYLGDLMERTAQAYAGGATLEEAGRQIAPTLIEQYGERISPTFSERVIANIEKAYRVVSGSTQ
jgi:glyoxylase-like metal-dependent hydrolase (beta-lactamase superfamily II)